MEAEAGRAESLFAQIARCCVDLTQARAAVVAEGLCRPPAGRTQRIRQVAVLHDAAVVVVHNRENYTTAQLTRCEPIDGRCE